MYRLVERDRKLEAEREGMTCRLRPLGAGFEPGSLAARTVASTHEAGAPPIELQVSFDPVQESSHKKCLIPNVELQMCLESITSQPD